MIRRFGTAPKPGTRYIRRLGAYALLPAGDYLLLTLQADPGPDLQLPGGGVDPGESPICALHREVMEETGWRIANPRRIGCYRRFTYMPEYDLWAEKICLIYQAMPVLRLGPPTEAGHSTVWMHPEEAATKLSCPGNRHYAAEMAMY